MKRRPPESFRRIGLAQIAREIDRTPAQTAKLLRKCGYVVDRRRIIGKPRSEITYDASAIEVVKAMLGIPHRPTPEPDDWLSTYEGEHHHGTT